MVLFWPTKLAKIHLVFGQLKWVALIPAKRKSSSHVTHCRWNDSWESCQRTEIRNMENFKFNWRQLDNNIFFALSNFWGQPKTPISLRFGIMIKLFRFAERSNLPFAGLGQRHALSPTSIWFAHTDCAHFAVLGIVLAAGFFCFKIPSSQMNSHGFKQPKNGKWAKFPDPIRTLRNHKRSWLHLWQQVASSCPSTYIPSGRSCHLRVRIGSTFDPPWKRTCDSYHTLCRWRNLKRPPDRLLRVAAVGLVVRSTHIRAPGIHRRVKSVQRSGPTAQEECRSYTFHTKALFLWKGRPTPRKKGLALEPKKHPKKHGGVL